MGENIYELFMACTVDGTRLLWRRYDEAAVSTRRLGGLTAALEEGQGGGEEGRASGGERL